MVLALQTIVARKLAPGAGAVVSVIEFITDGHRNVLPGHATLKGDVRARGPEDRRKMDGLIRQISGGIAAAHDVSIAVDFNAEFIETINSELPTVSVLRVTQAVGFDVVSDCDPMSFSEGFAHFSAAVPGCFLMLGNGQSGPHGQPLHSSDYDFNDALLPIGVKLWTDLVRDRLSVNGVSV